MVHGQAFRIVTRQPPLPRPPLRELPLYINHGRSHDPPWESSLVSCHDKLSIKCIQAVRIEFVFYIKSCQYLMFYTNKMF